MTAFQKYTLIFLIGLVLLSCRRHYRAEETKEVPFSMKETSPLFSDRYFDLHVDSGNNYLFISLEPQQAIRSFPFPKDEKGNYLSSTAFSFSFCINGKCINGAGLPRFGSGNNYFGYGQWLQQFLIYKTDTFDLLSGNPVAFKIPFYAFNQLKRRENLIELKCAQNVFCSPSTYRELRLDTTSGDSSYIQRRIYSKVSLIRFTSGFKIKVPQLFKTSVYGYGIELRNDSVYSPSGMDNTIWNSSYPDVYWTINYPDDNFYCSSDYQTSTAHYDLKDTFSLYHYTPNDSISIGVWDHDNLSRDDYIAWKRFSLNQFPRGKETTLSFGNIKAFGIKVKIEGQTNR